MRHAIYALGLGLAFLAGAFLIRRAEAAPGAAVAAGPSGRWQVVNGTPDQTQNIMLLDSTTGDTWVTCNGQDGDRVWCYVPRTQGTAVTGAPRRAVPRVLE